MKIDSMEEDDDKKSNEPDPRAALMLMLNARSNLLSSKSETGSKAVENDSEQEHPEDEIDNVPKLKDDPVYEKYYKMLKVRIFFLYCCNQQIYCIFPDIVHLMLYMLKVGLPMGAVRNAMTRDKLDPTVLDLDPEKSLESQRQPVDVPQLQEDPVVNEDAPIKDNPNLAKYHKMLKMVSLRATLTCMYLSPMHHILTLQESCLLTQGLASWSCIKCSETRRC